MALTKEQLQTLADRFGGCGCTQHCQMEQYGDEGKETKPRGRFSACKLEAEKTGVRLPQTPEEE